MLKAKGPTIAIFLLAMLGCVGCDQITKDIAREYLSGAPPTYLAFGTIQLVLVENTGAFMSLGSSLPESVRSMIFTVGVPVMLLILCGAFATFPKLTRVDALALALTVGGGAGNWLDRIFRDGAVTDFLRIGVGPVRTGIFNVADVAILLGVGLILASHWRDPHPEDVVNGRSDDQPEFQPNPDS